MKPSPDGGPIAPRKPRLALAFATALGLGYVPRIPGTVGSMGGAVLAVVTGSWLLLAGVGFDVKAFGRPVYWALYLPTTMMLVGVSLVGLWSASRVARFAASRDPQLVVIDEVSGQHLTLFLGLAPGLSMPGGTEHPGLSAYLLFGLRLLNWKYLLLGFILFRVFDIWKPFPVRQAEKLPRGWGIMADDWVAAVYAALGLWVARFLGL